MGNPFQTLLEVIDWIWDPFGLKRLSERKLPKGSAKKAPAPPPPPPKETGPPPPPFLALATEKNVHFQDDQKHPLISPGVLASKGTGYHVNARVIDEAVTAKVLEMFRDVAPRSASVPPASTGRFAGIPIPEVLMRATDEDLRAFLAYVDQYPKKYVGQEVRIANAFVAWVRSGAE